MRLSNKLQNPLGKRYEAEVPKRVLDVLDVGALQF